MVSLLSPNLVSYLIVVREKKFMNRIKMMLSTVIVFMTVLFRVKSSDPCSDQMVKAMAVRICAMDKRSFNTDSIWPLFKQLPRGYVEREYKKLVEEEPQEKFRRKLNKGKSKDSVDLQKHQRSSLSNALNLNLESILNTELISDNVKLSVYQKRDIKKLVSDCCTKSCTEEDFKSICDKK